MSIVNFDKIKGLIHTEKSNFGVSQNKYTFRVVKECNKKDLPLLMKSIFNVDVTKVNVINVFGKEKRFKGVTGSRSSFKKAIISLKEGQSINFQDL